MTMVTRRRDIPFKGINATIEWSTTTAFGTDKTVTPTSYSPVSLKGWQVTASESHPSWNRRSQNRWSGDIGGPFSSKKRYALSVERQYSTGYKRAQPPPFFLDYRWKSRCAVLPCILDNLEFPPDNFSSNSGLDAWGASAIADCKPTNSLVDVSNFLAELYREGLPKLLGASPHWESSTKRALGKGAADEYLNYEFGYAPVAREVGAFLATVSHADAVLKQYERDAGKVVRRRYAPPSVKTSSTSIHRINCKPVLIGGIGQMFDDSSPSGQVSKLRTTERRRWFSGAFTYHLPSGYSSRGMMSEMANRANKLYGLELTPETIWNLSPWSWAVDWFSSTGDVLSNISDWSKDGLVLKYGYVMEHTITTDTYTFEGPTGLVDPNLRPSVITLVNETKLRRKANPFGFGLTWDGLSTRQKAIAAALGISKS